MELQKSIPKEVKEDAFLINHRFAKSIAIHQIKYQIYGG
jgi:hypothetical protein